jgi:hypothetical protein
MKGVSTMLNKLIYQPKVLQTIPITWPFAFWCLDLVGSLQKAPGGLTHLLVTIDKFSKWIEARPIAQIKSE